MGQEFNVLALVKGEQRYVYVYDDPSRAALIEFFHAQAADPALNLSWFDAAVLTRKAEEQAGFSGDRDQESGVSKDRLPPES